MLTELEANPSISITNAVELIRGQLLEQRKIPELSQIIDHYSSPLFFSNEFNLVTFTPEGCPEWHGLSRTRVEALLECDPGEFDFSPEKDAWLQSEIRQALDGIPPIKTYRYIEPPEISERRLEIASGLRSQAELRKLIDSGATEQTIAAFLKKDLSFFSEVYACPKDEYICFSEFPVGDSGRVDFALFTGRSRMSVYLIEIKAARHPFCVKTTTVSSLLRYRKDGDSYSPVRLGYAQIMGNSAALPIKSVRQWSMENAPTTPFPAQRQIFR